VNLSRLPYSAGSTAGKVGETQISHKYHHEIQQTATVAGEFDKGNVLPQWQVGSWGCGDRTGSNIMAIASAAIDDRKHYNSGNINPKLRDIATVAI